MYQKLMNMLLIDPVNTNTHNYTNVLWFKCLNEIKIAALSLLACNTMNKAGLSAISFTFRNYHS